MTSQSSDQEVVSAEGRDAHKFAEVDQVDSLQVVQRELVIEELGKLGDLKVVHMLSRSDLQ